MSFVQGYRPNFYTAKTSVARTTSVHFAASARSSTIDPMQTHVDSKLVQKLLLKIITQLEQPKNWDVWKQKLLIGALIRQVQTSNLPPLLADCIRYATEAHMEQEYGTGGPPYNLHILSVALHTATQTNVLGTIMAALLHDVVEDQGEEARLQDVRQRFGNDVAAIVQGCSYKPHVHCSTTHWQERWIRKQLAMLEDLASESTEVHIVKRADSKHNTLTTLAGVRREGRVYMTKFTLLQMGELWKQNARLELFKQKAPNHAFVQGLEADLNQLLQLCQVTKEEVSAFDPWTLVPGGCPDSIQ